MSIGLLDAVDPTDIALKLFDDEKGLRRPIDTKYRPALRTHLLGENELEAWLRYLVADRLHLMIDRDELLGFEVRKLYF